MTPLEARLADLARRGQLIGYGALARELGLPLAALTAALETTMAADVAAGRPLRAALCEARLTPGLPARGFFQAAGALGLRIDDPAGFVEAQRAALWRDPP
jgi:hypothetical protein